jgi:hypothetical protein
MRTFKKLAVAAAVAASAMALTVGTAMADPPKGVTPTTRPS